MSFGFAELRRIVREHPATVGHGCHTRRTARRARRPPSPRVQIAPSPRTSLPGRTRGCGPRVAQPCRRDRWLNLDRCPLMPRKPGKLAFQCRTSSSEQQLDWTHSAHVTPSIDEFVDALTIKPGADERHPERRRWIGRRDGQKLVSDTVRDQERRCLRPPRVPQVLVVLGRQHDDRVRETKRELRLADQRERHQDSALHRSTTALRSPAAQLSSPMPFLESVRRHHQRRQAPRQLPHDCIRRGARLMDLDYIDGRPAIATDDVSNNGERHDECRSGPGHRDSCRVSRPTTSTS